MEGQLGQTAQTGDHLPELSENLCSLTLLVQPSLKTLAELRTSPLPQSVITQLRAERFANQPYAATLTKCNSMRESGVSLLL
jgi:hypothetical protein